MTEAERKDLVDIAEDLEAMASETSELIKDSSTDKSRAHFCGVRNRLFSVINRVDLLGTARSHRVGQAGELVEFAEVSVGRLGYKPVDTPTEEKSYED